MDLLRAGGDPTPPSPQPRAGADVSYLAIARKYRPATFEEIVGQRHVTRTLTNAITGDRIHHAYLFTGARGVGKTTAARALARALNCEQGPTPTPCGTCPSCVEVGTSTSPDLIEIDGASNNSVDDVREIRDSVQYAPTRGRRKIYLIDEVHMLSKGAFNALLKTLEEPPPHVLFIFATTEPNKIPDTILSRVQRFDFKRIAITEIVTRLGEITQSEGVQIGPSGLRMIARAGEGSMRDAQSLLDMVIAFGGQEVGDDQIRETLGLIDSEQIHRFVGAMVSGDPAGCMQVIAHVYGFGHELSVFTAEVLEALRNATFLVLSPGAERFVDLPKDEITSLQELTQGTDPEHLSRLFSAMLDVHDQVSRATRPRMVLEMAVARLATTRKAQPLTALLERLEQLESRLRSAPPGGSAPPRRDRPSHDPAPRGPEQPPSRGPRRTSPRSSRSDRGSSPASVAPPAPRPQPAQASATSQEHDSWSEPTTQGGSLADLDLSAPPPTVRRTKAARRHPNAPADEVWDRFCAQLLASDPALKPLTLARPLRDGGFLRLRFRPGRALVEATRAAESSAVAEALRASYPGLQLSIESIAGSGNGATDALERTFRADPALQRILEVLEAEVERVLPHPSSSTDEPSPESSS
ncbi:MAG: DNA polymerase III subunit gamma/tau [Deltaproteobacteria bacterium]|nr:MAG: DNA polymerase III subunit gamma/tau [Deltaproteobacteria bacterium]